MTKTSPFGEWLRKWRKARGLTQVQLANAAGCAQSTVSELERGERQEVGGEFMRPDPDLVERLATALRRPVEEARELAGYRPSPIPATVREVETTYKIEQYQNGELISVEVTTEKAKQILEVREELRKLMQKVDDIVSSS